MPEISNGENSATEPESREQVIERLKQKEFLTRKEAAVYLDMSIFMLDYTVKKDKNLNHAKIRLNKKVLLKRELLEQWLENKNALLQNAVLLQDAASDNLLIEKKRFEHREFLTSKEAALYIGYRAANLLEISKRDNRFNAARFTIYGRVYYKKDLIDSWLELKHNKQQQHIYVVTKIATGERFIVEAYNNRQAKMKLRKLNDAGKLELSAYSAKKVK